MSKGIAKDNAIIVGLLALFTIAPALAGSSRGYGDGGPIAAYLPLVSQYNKSGELFRIEGECKSACTLFLGIHNVCVERGAVLMFHAGHDIKADVTGPNTQASQIMLNAYSDSLREHLLEGHHIDTTDFYTLTGSVLIDRFGYKECSAE